jgi:hypothetical protein
MPAVRLSPLRLAPADPTVQPLSFCLTKCWHPTAHANARMIRLPIRPDRPAPAQVRGRARGRVLVDAANRLAIVEDRPVLAVLVDAGGTACRP